MQCSSFIGLQRPFRSCSTLRSFFKRNDVNWFIRFLITSTALTCLSVTSFAKNVNPESLQAAYIQKFINYIDWPLSTEEKFTIAVLNNQPMYEALTEAFSNGVVLGKQVQVISIDKIEKKTSYNILHVSRIDTAFIKELGQAKRQGLLVVGKIDSGASDHIQISFYFDGDGKLKFDINQTSALEHGLKINSRLLNLARSLK